MLETKTKKVLSINNYTGGFKASLDLNGNLLKQTLLELDNVLAINNQNALAICSKGNLTVKNPKYLSETNIYLLSTASNKFKKLNTLPNIET